jgi:DNA-binding Lrp family transcriptional regulator
LPRSTSASNKTYKDAILKTSSKQVLKLRDSINIKIISELVNSPTISSLALSKKLDIPLSTLQRRRTRIEKDILKKNYTFDYKAFGARVGDLIVNVDKGKSDEVAQSIIKNHKNNVEYCHTRIDSMHSVLAHTIYKNSKELYYLIEDVKAMEYVEGVQWSEMVNVVGDNTSEVMNSLLDNN